MIRKGIYCVLALLVLCSFKGMAQAVKTNIVPEGYQKAQLYEGDTMAVVNLLEVFIYPQVKFKNKREQALPNDKARQAHLKRMEKELFAQYKPELKKLSFSQGKLLIKLIDRECNQSSYNLLKAYLGSFRAGFWNFFAGMFGASLKSEYDPKGKDAMTERVVVLVENGLI